MKTNKIRLLLKIHLLIWFILAIEVHVNGQDNSLFSFDKGIGIVAPDSSVSLHVQMYLQNRIDVETLSTDDWTIDEFSARIRRFRMKFTGFILDPRLTYKFQLAMAPGNVGSTTLGQAPRVMYDAMIYYQLNDRLQLGLGQTVLPGNRQRMNSSSSLQLVDRSLMNSTFNIDLDFGLQAEYQFNPNGAKPLVFYGALTTGEGKNWVVVEQPGFSYTGRLDWYPLSSFLKNSAYKEGDLEWQPEPRIMTGISYNYNNRAQRSGGQRGSLLYANRNFSTLFADVIFKYAGWAIQTAYITRNCDDPLTTDPGGSGIRYIYTGNGFNAQISKYFKSKWEVVGRFSGVTPGEEITDLTAERREWVLGLNRYIKGRSVKLQADATLHQSRTTGSDYAGRFGFRFQVQVGF